MQIDIFTTLVRNQRLNPCSYQINYTMDIDRLKLKDKCKKQAKVLEELVEVREKLQKWQINEW